MKIATSVAQVSTRVDSGTARALACPFRRPRRNPLYMTNAKASFAKSAMAGRHRQHARRVRSPETPGIPNDYEHEHE
jgi:hypothetical protein